MYYTTYRLTAKKEVIERLFEIDSSASYFLTSDGSPNNSGNWWWDINDPLFGTNPFRTVSKLFPEELITLKAYGEDNKDMTIYYFKNGLMQECEAVITFEPFDETKLK